MCARADGTGGAQLVQPPRGRVFISCASKDKATADVVCAALEARGTRCWMAPRDVILGRDSPSALMDGLDGSSVMVLVFSSAANESPEVLREVERAASRRMPILPFRIEEVEPSESMGRFIRRQDWVNALTLPLGKHLAELGEIVEQLLRRTQ